MSDNIFEEDTLKRNIIVVSVISLLVIITLLAALFFVFKKPSNSVDTQEDVVNTTTQTTEINKKEKSKNTTTSTPTSTEKEEPIEKEDGVENNILTLDSKDLMSETVEKLFRRILQPSDLIINDIGEKALSMAFDVSLQGEPMPQDYIDAINNAANVEKLDEIIETEGMNNEEKAESFLIFGMSIFNGDTSYGWRQPEYDFEMEIDKELIIDNGDGTGLVPVSSIKITNLTKNGNRIDDIEDESDDLIQPLLEKEYEMVQRDGIWRIKNINIFDD